jgi:hypothetical protein
LESVVLSDDSDVVDVLGGVIESADVSITGCDWVGASERATSELSTAGVGLVGVGCFADRVSVGSWAEEGVDDGAVNHDGSLPYVDQSGDEAAGVEELEAEAGEGEPPVPK